MVPGTIGSNGEKNYVNELNQNLFAPLSAESMTCYGNADGNETKDGEKRLAKMKAIHSSSALVVNLFQYWQGKDLYPLLAACKLPTTKTVTKVHENVASSKKQIPDILTHFTVFRWPFFWRMLNNHKNEIFKVEIGGENGYIRNFQRERQKWRRMGIENG